MTVAAAVDPRSALLAAPMSLYQKVAVAMTVCLCTLDGFNVFAVTYAAPALRTAWHVGPAQLGLVLSSGLLGIAAGSLLIAPAADLIGRRRMIFLSLVLMIGGSLRSAMTHGVSELIVSWVVTGLGVGAMIAIISSLAAEYASARARDFSMTMFGVGFPLGGVMGGVLAAYLLPHYGWQAIFIAAAILGLVLLVLAFFFLPEPIAPMIARPKADTLVRVNAYLGRCRMPAIAELPPPPQEARSAPIKALFSGGQTLSSVLITAIYFLHVVTLFFIQSWAPSLIANEGFAPGQAALIGAWVSVGGIVGGPVLGANSMRFGLKTLVILYMGVGAVITAVFGLLPPNFLILAVCAIGVGFCLQGGMMGLYAVVARTFPAHMRVSGTGLVIGIGRIGSAVGPGLAGVLLTAGVSRGGVAILMAVPALIAALLLLRFRVQSPDTP